MTANEYLIVGAIILYVVFTTINLVMAISSIFSERIAEMTGIKAWSDVFMTCFFGLIPITNILVFLCMDHPFGIHNRLKPKHFK